MAPRKSHPKGINPAYPQKNFVQASFENKGEKDKFFDELYGSYPLAGPSPSKTSHFGHSIGQRAGKLRLSGNPRAHRIGKR